MASSLESKFVSCFALFFSTLILLQVIVLESVSCLKIVMLDVPSPVAAGESIELTCSYDLEGDRLYSVKYYKNGSEFYRYVPKEWPPAQFFAMPGIKVDVSRSDGSKVHLKYVDLKSQGVYRCEISAEAPSFNTAAEEKEMQIIVLPSRRPEVTTSSTDYSVGETLTASCLSSKSKPAASLKWFINDIPVQPQNVFEPLIKSYSDGLESSSLKLRIFLQHDHFKNGLLKVKCVASVLEGYQVSHETNVDVYERDMRVGDNEGDDNHDDTRQRQQQQIPQQNDNKSGQQNRRKKKNRNKQDKKTPVGGIHENMSQAHSSGRIIVSIHLLPVILVVCLFILP